MATAITLAEDIIKGKSLNLKEAKLLLKEDFYALMYSANRLRSRFKGNKVNLCGIINAKSGACSENCTFCAQSAHNRADIKKYPLVNIEEIKTGLMKAKSTGAKCFGIVTSGHRLSENELSKIAASIKECAKYGINVSASLGALSLETLKMLKESGLWKYHHNLETAESFFPSVCMTHSYAERVQTVINAKRAGLKVCSGGIFGLGENEQQRLEMAFKFRELDVDSIPLNFLNPIPGTALERAPRMAPKDILKIVALFRFILPEKDIAVCGGREVNLRDMQSWIFCAGANGMMAGGYLTTAGREPELDIQMINDLGLEI